MKVILTGATGRIGRVVAQHLVAQRHQLTAIDRQDGPVPAGVELLIGDLTDLDFVDKSFAGIEAVVHLGSIPSPNDERGYEVFSNNSSATYAVFCAAAQAGCRVVSYASSLSIYGTAWSPEWTSPAYAPCDEDLPIVYSESYALSKEVNELSALMWSRRCDTTFIGFRFPYTDTAEEIMKFAVRIKNGEESALQQSGKILWAYLDTRDAAAALDLSIRSNLVGAHLFNIAAPDTMASKPTAELLKGYHPTTKILAPINGFETIISSKSLESKIGFTPAFFLDREALLYA